jgi:methylamine dehydrogenase heavy chain
MPSLLGRVDHDPRGSRGARTDVVEFTDNSTLAVTHEIVLPPKRAMTIPTYFNLAYSADSRFLYVSYVTPAASFGVPTRRTALCWVRSTPPAAYS